MALAWADSCTRAPVPGLTREAFLTFDNLTGDAAYDWIAQAAPRMLEHDLTGLPKTVALNVAAVRDAYLEHATRLVHGYFERRSGKLHFQIDVEDAEAHRMIQTAVEDGEPVAAMNRAAKILDPAASAFPASPEAAEAWGQGRYENAVKLDPDFALAWTAWIEQAAATAAGDPSKASEARELAGEAMSQPGLRGPIDRARVELAAAGLRQDESARIAAARKLVQLIPADASLLGALAELEMNARRFSDSAHDYQELARTDPGNVGTGNLLGYADAFAGDMEGARKAFEEYGRRPGQAVNALDSLGEAYFVNGKFEDAEKAFLEAYTKDPSFLQGVTLWKAAHARWLAGDLAKADIVVERYWKLRADARDALLDWRRANWLYETGRREQAVQLLKMEPETKTSAEAADVAARQLRVWDNLQSLPSDPDSLEKDYLRANPVSDGLVRTLYAAALVKAGRSAEAKSLVKLWPLPETGDSLLQALMYPEFMELRKTLQP